MSGRPRLVEEGTPLWSNDDEQDHSRDHLMHDAQQQNQHEQPAHQRRTQHGPGHPIVAPASGSSLSRAVGPVNPHFQFHHHIQTRMVIGGDQQQEMMPPPPQRDDDPQHPYEPMMVDKDGSHMSHDHERHQHHVPSSKKGYHISTRLVVGGEQPTNARSRQEEYDDRPVERMEGVEHNESKGPLVVLDGANVAYAYADAMASLESVSVGHGSVRREPDPRGIQVAANYFLSVGVRVLVVIPAPWFRVKPRASDANQSNAMMLTPQLEVLKDLKAQGLLLASPPTDDDDAYALTVARREDARAHRRGDGGGFVLSCDMFRDAVGRDRTGELKDWLLHGSGHGPGRISFAFCDLGSRDDYGDRQMDFVPNPRHELIQRVEQDHRKQSYHQT